MKHTQRHTQQQKCSAQTSSFEGRVYTYKYFPPLPTVPGCLKNRKKYRPVYLEEEVRWFLSCSLWALFLMALACLSFLPFCLGRAFTTLLQWPVEQRSWEEGGCLAPKVFIGGGISTPTWQCQSHGKCQSKSTHYLQTQK